MVVIPKATLIERIRSRSGPEAADSANEELPDRLDLDSDTDARLLHTECARWDSIQPALYG